MASPAWFFKRPHKLLAIKPISPPPAPAGETPTAPHAGILRLPHELFAHKTISPPPAPAGETPEAPHGGVLRLPHEPPPAPAGETPEAPHGGVLRLPHELFAHKTISPPPAPAGETPAAPHAGVLTLPHELFAHKTISPPPAPAGAAATPPHAGIPKQLPHEMMIKKRSVPSPPPAREQFSLSDFLRIDCIGFGSSGFIYKVRHRDTGREYALKAGHQWDGYAEAEAYVLFRCMASPRIVRCHAMMIDEHSGEVGLLLELMEAGSLDRILRPRRRRRRRRSFPEAALAEVAMQCLDGLMFLHSHNIVHLDVKPGNLLTNASGDIKICDMGFSQVLGGHYPGRNAFTAGTPSYMSCERFSKKPYRERRNDAFAADVWSLGITLMELFSGRRPPGPIKQEGSEEWIIEAPLPSLPEASTELQEFLSACLQKDAHMRPKAQQLLQHPFVAGRDVEESRRALKKLISASL